MNRAQRRALGLFGRARAVHRLRESLFALTRYIVDADPYKLLVEFGQDVVSITDYAFAVQDAGVEPGEKVEAHGVRNLHGEDLADFQAEMLSVAARAPKMESPLLHIIISLKEGESWTEEQREDAINIMLETLGLERCQVLWAEHSNTKNAHLHLSIVRVDPLTGKACGSAWLIDDLHQALALIEERQERGREPGALYVAREGVVYDADTNIMVRDADGRFIKGWYKELGRKHDRMPAKMRPMRASIIDAAQGARSWSRLHENMGDIGVTYDRSGSGARISFEGQSVIASEVHETLSRPQLEKWLGAFEPDLGRLNPGHEAYRDVFETQLKQLRLERDKQRQRLRQWLSATLASLPSSADRDVVSVIRLEAKAADDTLVEAFKLAIARYTKHRLNEKSWLEADQPKAPPPTIAPTMLLPGVADGIEESWTVPSQLDRRETAFSTEYRFFDGTPLFTDHRVLIVVQAPNCSGAIDEALLIAAARWKSVTARGPDEYLELVAQRAAALGIEVLNAEAEPLCPKAVEEARPTPTPAAEPNPSAGWKKPDLADDPIRRERIEAAIEHLRDFRGLPLKRRHGPDDAEKGGRSGDFEIILTDDPMSDRTQRLSAHAAFDEDPVVQTYLGQRRKEMLEGWCSLLLGSAIDPHDMSRANILTALPKQSEVRYPASLAYDDFDFQEMLRDVRERILEREKQERAAAGSRTVSAAAGQSIERESRTIEQHSSTEGVSLEDQQAYRARRAAQQR